MRLELSRMTWRAVYVGGKLIHQGHDIPTFVWMDVVKMGIADVCEWYCDFEYDGHATEQFVEMLEKESMRRNE